ncbi:MAG: NrfD/PsrC family molybdoenzyme membrane anchor subunit [Planctomycetota bacterium]|jgi:Ni/Fe-hydrogenase subunit HybB-like protein
MAHKSARLITIVTPWRIIGGVIIMVGLIAAVIRFRFGLGSVTNLSNEYPWGIWIGFKFIAIGLAAGGFTVTAIVYLFGNMTLKPIARAAVLTAFIGYLTFVISLAFDIGRWWNLPQPFFPGNLNFHSVLWEIAVCVAAYTAILILELLEPVFEKFGWNTLLRFRRVVSVPLVLLGVLLSILHQSSLGSLMAILPQKMHPLWYSMMQPVIFLVTCIAAGLAMTIFVSCCAKRFLKKSLDAVQLKFLFPFWFACWTSHSAANGITHLMAITPWRL